MLWVQQEHADGTCGQWFPTLVNGNPVVVTLTLSPGDNWSVHTDIGAPVSASQLPTLISDANAAGVPRLGLGKGPGFTAQTLASLGQISTLCSLGLGSSFSGEDLAGVGSLSQLRELGLFDVVLAGSDLIHLRPMTDLSCLRAQMCSVSDLSPLHNHLTQLLELHVSRNPALDSASLPFIQSQAGLQVLDVDGTGLSESELRTIAASTSLHSLDFQRIRVSDAFLQHLCGLPNLWEMLRVRTDSVTKTGMVDMAKLSSLTDLSFVCPNATGIDLAPLAGLPLRSLDLQTTPVVDAELAHLYQKMTLREVFLMKTLTTPSGRAQLRSELHPSCVVIPPD